MLYIALYIVCDVTTWYTQYRAMLYIALYILCDVTILGILIAHNKTYILPVKKYTELGRQLCWA